MWLVHVALRRPYTFVCVAILMLVFGIVAILRMPVDIFQRSMCRSCRCCGAMAHRVGPHRPSWKRINRMATDLTGTHRHQRKAGLAKRSQLTSWRIPPGAPAKREEGCYTQAMTFDFAVSNQGNYAVITLSGSLTDKRQATGLLQKVDALAKANCNKWAIDLHGLTDMSSSGLNALLQLLTKARAAGGEAALFNVNDTINKLILVTKLHIVYKVADNEEVAMALLGV